MGIKDLKREIRDILTAHVRLAMSAVRDRDILRTREKKSNSVEEKLWKKKEQAAVDKCVGAAFDVIDRPEVSSLMAEFPEVFIDVAMQLGYHPTDVSSIPAEEGESTWPDNAFEEYAEIIKTQYLHLSSPSFVRLLRRDAKDVKIIVRADSSLNALGALDNVSTSGLFDGHMPELGQLASLCGRNTAEVMRNLTNEKYDGWLAVPAQFTRLTKIATACGGYTSYMMEFFADSNRDKWINHPFFSTELTRVVQISGSEAPLLMDFLVEPQNEAWFTENAATFYAFLSIQGLSTEHAVYFLRNKTGFTFLNSHATFCLSLVRSMYATRAGGDGELVTYPDFALDALEDSSTLDLLLSHPAEALALCKAFRDNSSMALDLIVNQELIRASFDEKPATITECLVRICSACEPDVEFTFSVMGEKRIAAEFVMNPTAYVRLAEAAQNYSPEAFGNIGLQFLRNPEAFESLLRAVGRYRGQVSRLLADSLTLECFLRSPHLFAASISKIANVCERPQADDLEENEREPSEALRTLESEEGSHLLFASDPEAFGSLASTMKCKLGNALEALRNPILANHFRSAPQKFLGDLDLFVRACEAGYSGRERNSTCGDAILAIGRSDELARMMVSEPNRLIALARRHGQNTPPALELLIQKK